MTQFFEYDGGIVAHKHPEGKPPAHYEKWDDNDWNDSQKSKVLEKVIAPFNTAVKDEELAPSFTDWITLRDFDDAMGSIQFVQFFQIMSGCRSVGCQDCCAVALVTTTGDPKKQCTFRVKVKCTNAGGIGFLKCKRPSAQKPNTELVTEPILRRESPTNIFNAWDGKELGPILPSGGRQCWSGG